MLDRFWEGLGENLSEKWLRHILGPSLLFWAGGVILYMLNTGWNRTWGWLSNLPPLQQGVLLFLVLMTLACSSLLMGQLRYSILRLLEGHWPWPFGRIAEILIRFKHRQNSKAEMRLVSLKTRHANGQQEIDEKRVVELEMHMHYVPANPKHLLPTTLGNILRAGETAPTHKYGLDAHVCWPRLWLLLPETTRQDLSAVRNTLMVCVELWAWGLLFLLWMIWSPWAILISVGWMFFAYTLSIQAARVYADLIESTFDLYRWDLYRAARWPLPRASGEDEIKCGQQLTEFLWRGLGEKSTSFTLIGEE